MAIPVKINYSPFQDQSGYNVVNLSPIGFLASLMDGLSGIVPGLALNVLCPGSPLSLQQTEGIGPFRWYFIRGSVSVSGHRAAAVARSALVIRSHAAGPMPNVYFCPNGLSIQSQCATVGVADIRNWLK